MAPLFSLPLEALNELGVQGLRGGTERKEQVATMLGNTMPQEWSGKISLVIFHCCVWGLDILLFPFQFLSLWKGLKGTAD